MKKLMDDKGRLFGKLNIIDFGILLIVVILAIGVFVKFVVLDQTSISTEESPVQYTIEIKGVRDFTANNIQVGDTLYVSGTNVGTVTAVTMEPYNVVVNNGLGDLWTADVPDRYMVLVDVDATATESEGGFLVSRTVQMNVGNSTTTFYSKFAEFNATVREIDFYEG